MTVAAARSMVPSCENSETFSAMVPVDNLLVLAEALGIAEINATQVAIPEFMPVPVRDDLPR